MHRSAWLIVLAACRGGSPEAESTALPAAAVTCKPAASAPVEDAIEVTGQIAPPPRFDATISSPVAGRVAHVAVEEGDRVAAGALLATIEDPQLPAGTIEARAQVASADAAKTAADLELARQQRLVESGIGAKRDLEEARAKAAAATAELEAARAREGLANRQLARRELRAPYAGIVLHVWKRTGESVDGTTATPVVQVADVTVLELRAQVPPKALIAIRDGMPAVAHASGIDGAITGKVARVAPAVDPATLLGTVRIELAAGTRLPVGSAAHGRIVTGTHAGVVVPVDALRRSIAGGDELVVCEGGQAAQATQATKTARIRAVTIGQRTETTAEIVKGLTAGEPIAIDHALGIEDGQALAPPEDKK